MSRGRVRRELSRRSRPTATYNYLLNYLFPLLPESNVAQTHVRVHARCLHPYSPFRGAEATRLTDGRHVDDPATVFFWRW